MQGSITLLKQPQSIPEHYEFGDSVVVPMWAGQELAWRVSLLS